MEGGVDGDPRPQAPRIVEPSGIRVIDSILVEWTDEKHRLYLNSMEASFVNQLYKSECQPKDFQRWLNESFDLSSSYWIQHVRSSGASHPIPQNKSDQNKLCSQSSALNFQGEVKHPKHYTYPQKGSVGSTTEMSDQNFVDIEFKGATKASRAACHRKRARTAAIPGMAKSFDQIVPQRKLGSAPTQHYAAKLGGDATATATKPGRKN